MARKGLLAYEADCRAGDGAACYAIAHHWPPQHPKGRVLIELGCELGNRHCCNLIEDADASR